MDSSLNITLPQDVQAFVDAQVKVGGYTDAADFVLSVLKSASDKAAKEHVEQLLEEGLNSEFSEMTKEDWEALKESVRSKARSAGCSNGRKGN